MTENIRIHPQPRDDFSHFVSLQTRWSDNDVYQHINNAQYYHFIDTVVNQYLIEQGALEINRSPIVGLVVDTRCTYFSPLAFPACIDCGLRVARVGHSSVVYEIGLFAQDSNTTAAFASFVHVYVERESSKPVALPQALRDAVERLARK